MFISAFYLLHTIPTHPLISSLDPQRPSFNSIRELSLAQHDTPYGTLAIASHIAHQKAGLGLLLLYIEAHALY
eukprot:COSAG02_NODE_5_length_66751_cov_63.939148_30_plen_73_part_00